MTLDELNALPREAAVRELERCCGSTSWAITVAARLPLGSIDELHRVAEEAWWSLDANDWLEAFSHHPRIGERKLADGWAKREQSGMRNTPASTADALTQGNREYERKFGHVFLICATGKSGEEMLANLKQRLSNDAATELRVAAEEQAKITRLRLDKLVLPKLAIQGHS